MGGQDREQASRILNSVSAKEDSVTLSPRLISGSLLWSARLSLLQLLRRPGISPCKQLVSVFPSVSPPPAEIVFISRIIIRPSEAFGGTACLCAALGGSPLKTLAFMT